MFYLYNVLIGRNVSVLNRTFSYYFDDDSIKKGMRVAVDFGNSKNVISFVLSDPVLIDDDVENYQKENKIRLSKIKSKLDDFPIFTDQQFKLTEMIAKYYKCNLISVIDSFLPPALKNNKSSINKATSSAVVTYITINNNVKNISLNKNETILYEKIKASNGLPISKISAKKALQSLLYKNVVLKSEEKVSKLQEIEVNKLLDFELTEQQNKSYEYLINSENKVNLLHGVTGSGKTAVYIKLIDYYLNRGKSVLILVPEISLINQNANILFAHYKDLLAIINSSISTGLKYETYFDILLKKKRVILGTRSAIFAPIADLGLIIIDEEHSSSYKQDKSPFYDARNVANMLSTISECKVILGSATPSLLTMAKAKRNVYGYTKLSSSYSKLQNREIEIIDLNDSNNFNPHLSSIISIPLREEIQSTLLKKEQVLILINRRGYSPLCICSNCNSVAKCPNCDVPLVYHNRTNLLKCHHCDYQVSKAEYKCHCGHGELEKVGFGTERISLELESLFPSYKISYLDSDVCSKTVRDQTLLLFSRGDIDILVGTQLLAKGHDFKNVTLATIVDCDALFTFPSYTAGEEAFDIISQFIGRSGRRNKLAKVVIQTLSKDNIILKLALKQDYDSFYNYEIEERRKYKYPPYTYLTLLTIRSYKEDIVISKANQMRLYLGKKFLNKRVDLLGPIVPYINHINNKYLRQILIKYKSYADIEDTLDDLISFSNREKDYELVIDVDPIHEI